MLNVCNPSKKYFTADGQIVALDNINLQVKEGEYIAIVRKSGSGKTTLLNMIAGLDIPDSGSILFDADDHLLCVLPLANSKAQCRRLLRTSYQRMHEYCYCGADGYYVYYRQNLLQYAK